MVIRPLYEDVHITELLSDVSREQVLEQYVHSFEFGILTNECKIEVILNGPAVNSHVLYEFINLRRRFTLIRISAVLTPIHLKLNVFILDRSDVILKHVLILILVLRTEYVKVLPPEEVLFGLLIISKVVDVALPRRKDMPMTITMIKSIVGFLRSIRAPIFSHLNE